MSLPKDYAERVYAGVLGKLIGVYLGRPFEGWSYDEIMNNLGEIEYYVNDKVTQIVKDQGGPDLPRPIVVTDDDVTGTFTFLRALEDYGISQSLTARDIGQTWLNYLVEKKSILWWGGMGNSTEHTAYLRLKKGIEAPQSGSIELNGRIIAEQIGSQIFIDGWAMVAPGNPDLAVSLATKAASVSHDGEAIYGAVVLAAMEAAAFVEKDVDKLINIGLSYIPEESVIYQMIQDIRHIHASEPDWHKGFAEMKKRYNYALYGGNCHMVPNHGLIILALLYGDWDFEKTMLVVNTAGWDTDCNSGNVGCLVGIRNGLSAFEGRRDWRGPIADRLYLPSADGGRSITDAVLETDRIVQMARVLAGEPQESLKEGARFHFEYRGAVQGFQGDSALVSVENIEGHSRKGTRCLQITFAGEGLATTPTFILPDELWLATTHMGYKLLASPTLYAGQKVSVGLSAPNGFSGTLILRHFNAQDTLDRVTGPDVRLAPGEYKEISWIVPDVGRQPIADIGFASSQGTLCLDYLTWSGTPTVTFGMPRGAERNLPWNDPQVWQYAFVDSMDQALNIGHNQALRLVQNEGRGLMTQGTAEWGAYAVEADIKPWLVKQAGIAARVQGLKRYYALLLTHDKRLVLLKALDGDQFLGEVPFKWTSFNDYQLKLEVDGHHIKGYVDGKLLLEVADDSQPLETGFVGYVVEEGHINSHSLSIWPI